MSSLITANITLEFPAREQAADFHASLEDVRVEGDMDAHVDGCRVSGRLDVGEDSRIDMQATIMELQGTGTIHYVPELAFDEQTVVVIGPFDCRTIRAEITFPGLEEALKEVRDKLVPA